MAHWLQYSHRSMPPTERVPTTEVRKVLVVDDQADVREALRLLLKGAGYSIQMADSPDTAIAAAMAGDQQLMVIDMNYAYDTTSGREGIALLDHLRVLKPGVPVIAMTGWSTIELAVEAMQHGACDFVTQPWETRHLLELFEKHLGAESRRRTIASSFDNELAIARRVQTRLLPPACFTTSDLEIDCAFVPAGEVGGDLYDFFETECGGDGFLLGDVCGKGLGAALLVANLQATIRAQRDLAGHPARLLERINRLFFHSTRPEHIATLFFGIYEPATNILRFANCGHPSPVLLRTNGTAELLAPTAMVLGAFENTIVEEGATPLLAGDRLLVFSDGFAEAGLSAGSDNDDWALDTIRLLARTRCERFAGRLAATATSAGEQADDITVMEVRVGGDLGRTALYDKIA
jgi:sigma-B regulation protein RsbU (phosphoserine phosphatase)